MTDAEIRRGIQSDSDAAPELGASWFRNARIVVPERKQALSIRLDRDVMEWFRRQGKGYQTRINAVLRAYVDAPTILNKSFYSRHIERSIESDTLALPFVSRAGRIVSG